MWPEYVRYVVLEVIVHFFFTKPHNVHTKLARSSHLGDSIVEGEFRGLDKTISVIEVSTALHEQFNWLDSITPTGLHIANREISRKGLRTDGIKESILTGWNRLSAATKQYSEILEPEVACCQRSGLTTAKSLQLYVSNFDCDSTLSTCDRIFLQAHRSEKSKHCALRHPYVQTGEAKQFFEKAADLGFLIIPHEQRCASILPPLFHSYQKQCMSSEFEQINEDMYSRKENKFMVFNGAGVESWSGTQSITKTYHVLTLGDEGI